MQKGKFNGIFEKVEVTERLARKFYELQGCKAPDEPKDYMTRSRHPQEQACYSMALVAIQELMKS